jgi:hypothetical protein
MQFGGLLLFFLSWGGGLWFRGREYCEWHGRCQGENGGEL